MACKDWANTKAAYRFLNNEQVHEEAILDGHFQATYERFSPSSGPILILHDTTMFSSQRDNHEPIVIAIKAYGGKDEDGRHQSRAQCGIQMHFSLAVTPKGVPLGLHGVKFWSRKKFKGCTALKRKINPARVLIAAKESIRWLDNLRQLTILLKNAERCVHIGEHESDIYELFCLAQQLGTHFLFRTCVARSLWLVYFQYVQCPIWLQTNIYIDLLTLRS